MRSQGIGPRTARFLLESPHLLTGQVMPDPPQIAYDFANFRLLPGDKRLLRDGKPVRLAPKVFDTLLLLVENQGRLVEKDDFLTRLWPDTFVEEVTLAHSISELRKA